MEKYFFDIPVYRLKKDRYYKDLDAYVKKTMNMEPLSNDDRKQFYERNPMHKRDFEQYLREVYGGAWDYNEIIGWIRLYFLGSQIRGEFWRVKAKRLVRSRKKHFKYHSWKLAAEINIPYKADNIEIFKLVLNYLSDCQKELKGRPLDTSRLDVVGPYVDWRSLMNSPETV